MMVFITVNGHLRPAEFHYRLSRVLNEKTKNEEEGTGILKLLNRFGILGIGDEISVKNETYSVISREEVPRMAYFSSYNLKRIGRNERIY